jgi:dynein heavy chain
MLFGTLLELQPKDSGGGDEGASGVRSKNEITQDMIKLIIEDMNMKSLIFNIDEIKNKMDAESKGPYQNVFLQEIEYMNFLLVEIVRSLDEIDQGFRGILTISE